jgi:hypothetical protein
MRSIIRLEFTQNARDMSLYRIFPYSQMIRHELVRQASRDESKHF